MTRLIGKPGAGAFVAFESPFARGAARAGIHWCLVSFVWFLFCGLCATWPLGHAFAALAGFSSVLIALLAPRPSADVVVRGTYRAPKRPRMRTAQRPRIRTARRRDFWAWDFAGAGVALLGVAALLSLGGEHDSFSFCMAAMSLLGFESGRRSMARSWRIPRPVYGWVFEVSAGIVYGAASLLCLCPVIAFVVFCSSIGSGLVRQFGRRQTFVPDDWRDEF